MTNGIVPESEQSRCRWRAVRLVRVVLWHNYFDDSVVDGDKIDARSSR